MFSYRHIKYLNANVPVERSVFSCLYFYQIVTVLGEMRLHRSDILETKCSLD